MADFRGFFVRLADADGDSEGLLPCAAASSGGAGARGGTDVAGVEERGVESVDDGGHHGEGGAPRDVVTLLAVALERASAVGRWDVVAQLGRELEARRLESAGNVVVMGAKRKGS